MASSLVSQLKGTAEMSRISGYYDNETKSKYHQWLNVERYYNNAVTYGSCAGAMIDCDLWNGYKNSNYAEYAIGGPSMEMFCESYNSTHTGDDLVIEQKQNGYKIYNGSESDTYSVGSLMTNNKVDDLYFGKERGNGYWLASPAAYAGHHSMVSTNGGLLSIWNDDGLCWFRPVVCLNSGVHLEEHTNDGVTTYTVEI